MIKITICLVVLFLVVGCGQKEQPKIRKAKEAFIRLKPAGKEILKNSGFVEIFNDPENRKIIMDLVIANNPKTRIDAQKMSRDALMLLKDLPMFKKINKNDLEICFVLVRDEVIKELDLGN